MESEVTIVKKEKQETTYRFIERNVDIDRLE